MARPLVLVLLVAFAVGCGDDAANTPADYPFAEPPSSTIPEPGVRRELFWVDGSVAPDNPSTGDATPASLNRSRVLRYRQDVEPAVAPRAVLVAMPGFLGGGPSFDGLARALVLRGAASGEALEVWAIDRRSNALEDLRGMDTAEASADPGIARAYYQEGATIDGEAFAGYHPQADVGFLSEWGLETHFEDLRAVIALIPQSQRVGHVFLMGHSLGSAMTEAYAAWRFEDGVRGVEELAGVILVDGILGDAPTGEAIYLDGEAGDSVGGLNGIRAASRYAGIPLLGIDVYTQAEYLSLRVLEDPAQLVDDPLVAQSFSLILGLAADDVPLFTAAGALGAGFDAESNPLGFARASLGAMTGGPVELYTSLLGGMLLHPTDPDATYGWIDALDADPVEYTPVENLALSFTHGQSNFAEWYFPSRLSLDVRAVGGAAVPEGAASYHEAHGLRAFDGALMDAPILCAPAALVGDIIECERVRARVAATIGGGRPQAGQVRGVGSTAAFRVLDATALAHLDPVLGADAPANPVPASVESFVMENVEAGTVTPSFP